MEKKQLLLIGGMIVLGAIVFTQVRKMGTPPPVDQSAVKTETIVEKVEYVPVLAAAMDIGTGSRLSEDTLSFIDWPKEALTPNLIVKDEGAEDVMSKYIGAIASQPIYEGETISRGKIIMAGESGVMAALLAPGMRAVTTRISVDTAAGGFIQPGDRVDIIMRESLQVANNQQNENSGGIRRDRVFIARTVFEDVKVLAIDQTFSAGAETGAAIPGSTATFELSPQDTELLQEIEGMGDLYLTLRGVRGSRVKARSHSTTAREDKSPAPSSLTIYRNGEAQSVALQER